MQCFKGAARKEGSLEGLLDGQLAKWGACKWRRLSISFVARSLAQQANRHQLNKGVKLRNSWRHAADNEREEAKKG